MLLLGTLALGGYTGKVLQPKAVALGYAPISRRQRVWFTLGFVGIWVASDWPVHDIAESHLYSVHMLQHLLLSMLIPACFVLATPRWLFELLVTPESGTWRMFRWMSSPLVAGLAFNALSLGLHWPRLVQLSSESGTLHFTLHLLIFTFGMLMWMPVIGPITEWRLQPLAQCIYLFSMSIVPTVPGGWLVFAEGVVYRHYDTPSRLWGVDVLTDQQAAGAIMKLFGGFVLWAIIVVIFSRWAGAEGKADTKQRKAIDLERIRDLDERAASDGAGDALTFEDVTRAFAAAPAPPEPAR
ncbi:MAG: cytochrome c oxidase assembly protein [Actinomycetota bacterium]|nr:cytochrome c oxidase assembly protein [Actinomycetota bacterium]